MRMLVMEMKRIDLQNGLDVCNPIIKGDAL